MCGDVIISTSVGRLSMMNKHFNMKYSILNLKVCYILASMFQSTRIDTSHFNHNI